MAKVDQMIDSRIAVGIDLGTTNSVLAHLDATGRPVTVRSAEGELTTPSVVLFDDEDVIVGKEALKAISREAEQVADCVKRDVGQRVYHRRVDGQQLPPEVIEAYVLNKLKADATHQIGDFRDVVITVPAYFDEVRRKATQDAGYIAGLNVLDIINEPVAAALAWGTDRGYLSPQGESTEKQTLLVYDLGGGTFDVTVMTIHGSDFTALATDGDVRLGGRDWDERLVNFVAEQFAAVHGFDPRNDPNCAGALWRECEDAKRTLSARQKAVITCDFRGRSLPIEVSRRQFTELTSDLLERTEFTTRQVIRAAGLDWGRIDRILLVGGSTRMPMVADMLEHLSGKRVDRATSPDEAVAHGAAIHAGLLLEKHAGRKPRFTIHNVNSHSLGVVGTEARTGEKQTVVLIPRNTRLPAKVKRIFRTQEPGQRSVLVPIVEGESLQPEACTQIGQCVVNDLPSNLPARSAVAVVFAYAGNGRLTIHVRVIGTTRKVTHAIVRHNGLPQAELDQWQHRIDSST